MRFAWLRDHTANYQAVKQAFTHPLALIRMVYNVVFWAFLLPFLTRLDYGTGFLIFAVIIGIRLVLNLYTNNVLHLSPAGYDRYPFRIP